MVVLRAAVGYQLDARADAVAVAFGAAQRNIQPVTGLFAAVHPDLRVRAERRDDHVDAPVSVKVAESAATMARGRDRGQSGFLGQRFPLAGGAWIVETPCCTDRSRCPAAAATRRGRG